MVVDWLNATEGDRVFLSAVTIGEIQCGISNRPPSSLRTELEVWLNVALPSQFAGRVLPLDGDTFTTWGRMVAQQRREGNPMGVINSLIAATALHHSMVLVTRNADDFKVTGLSILNPWG
jgi:toxin FitB